MDKRNNCAPHTRNVLKIALVATWLPLVCAPVRAQESVESFYKDRVITISIGFPTGGSYDTYARLAAAYMGQYIPGHPSFIVQNKASGGIGVLRSFYETAPKDGSMIGIFPETIAIVQLTQPSLGKWKVENMSYIGSFSSVNAVFLLRKGAPAHNLEELKKTPVIVGCNSPLGQAYINPTIMKRLGGFPFHIVCGYPGNSGLQVALARGEIDMTSGAWTGWKNRPEVRNGEVKPVLQSGLERNKDIRDVPLMQDLISDPHNKKVTEFLTAGSTIGRALIAPPGVPAERIAALREAFDRLVKDSGFLEQASTMGAEIDPKSGTEIQAISNAILATTPDIVQSAVAAAK